MTYSEQMHYCLTKVKALAEKLGRIPNSGEFKNELPRVNIDLLFGTYDNFLKAAGLVVENEPVKLQARDPRILVLDIETKPLVVYSWGLYDQNIGLDQIIEDWSIMSFAAKWIGTDEVIYQDVSQNEDFSDDQILALNMWELLDTCDVIITQNGVKFDERKLNTRFEKYKLGRPSPYRHIDALKIKKKHFGLTSNKLAYTSEFFNETYKKKDHAKFPGFKLWRECLAGNQEAWQEMKDYNIHDVLALEEEYLNSLRKWDSTINYGVYNQTSCCPNCGAIDFKEADYEYTKTAAYARLMCKKCGTYSKLRTNELSKAMRKELLK